MSCYRRDLLPNQTLQRTHLLSAQHRCVEVVPERAMPARSVAALFGAFGLFSTLNALIVNDIGGRDVLQNPAPRPRRPTEGRLGLRVHHGGDVVLR